MRNYDVLKVTEHAVVALSVFSSNVKKAFVDAIIDYQHIIIIVIDEICNQRVYWWFIAVYSMVWALRRRCRAICCSIKSLQFVAASKKLPILKLSFPLQPNVLKIIASTDR